MANAPIYPLQVIQTGIETTRGTAVAATHALDFTPNGATLGRKRDIIRIRQAGSLATAHRSYAGRDLAQLDINASGTYDWLPFILNHFLGPLATGTGASADKTWTFDGTVVSDTADNLKSSTWEVGGKDTWPSEFQIAGVVGQTLEIDIKQIDTWRVKASFIGMKTTPQAKTGAISPLPGLQDIVAAGTKVYIDTASAFGTTQVVGTIVSANIKIVLGVDPRFPLDQTNPYRIAVVKPRDITAKIIAEFNAQTYYTNWNAATAQRVRVVQTGPSLGGTNYKAQIDIPGVWTEIPFGDDNGIVTQELLLGAQYDATPAADINAVVVNASAALP